MFPSPKKPQLCPPAVFYCSKVAILGAISRKRVLYFQYRSCQSILFECTSQIDISNLISCASGLCFLLSQLSGDGHFCWASISGKCNKKALYYMMYIIFRTLATFFCFICYCGIRCPSLSEMLTNNFYKTPSFVFLNGKEMTDSRWNFIYF